ncbi:cytochrome P450 [Novosphingobium cyanobacteriorum]|uniref:Cytochrome P450 n=1 Tax=Novosphingobium cyanobacteriorum TaxID=3024215 RepID=A0ABT6CIU3_9SPHN|nr:cytochrome P450 [Novosphingobium cyanobacteriorum]MDF8333458.1 cytochrome P450 [Novosphingobium cyanobacteriorum]
MIAEAPASAAFRYDPYSPAMDADPFPAYRTLRDEYPCFWSEEAGKWVLSRYHDILGALQDWRTYSSAKGNLVDEFPGRAGSTLGSSDPPRHDRLRALIQSAVTKRALDHIVEPARASCRAHLAALDGRREFDLVNDYGARVTVDLLFHLFALPEENADLVRRNAVLMVQTDPVTRKKGEEHLAAFRWMADYAQNLVQERKKNPGDDLLSNFITAEIDGEKLLDLEVQLTVTTLIMAGIESLSGFMAMFGLNMAELPDVRRKIAGDRSLITDAIEESLRFNTSAQRFKRTLTCDVELHGQVMKAGDAVILAYGSANRDERMFENPDVYDLARRPKRHLGFGGGVHACLGSAIGRLATQIAYEELLAVVPDFTRTTDRLDWVSSSNFRSPKALPVARG